MNAETGPRGSFGWWAAVLAAMLVLLVPLCLAPIPPIEDYPGHLARLYVLAFGAHDANLSRMYAPAWHIIPNLAIDLIVPPAMRVLPADVAGRVALGITLLLPSAGVLALHRALHRRRSWWPLSACLIAYNAIFMLGFMNFLIGLGAALLVGALWLALRRRNRVGSTAALAAGALIVFFCHIVALALLGLLTGCLLAAELWAAWRRGTASARLVLPAAAELAGGFAIPALLYATSRLAGAQSDLTFSSLKLKLTELLSPVLVYHPLLDGAAALAILAPAALSLPWRRRTPAPVLPAGIALALAALLIAFAATPFATKGGAWLDARFPIMAACLLIAGLAPPPMPRGVRATFALAIAALLALRTAGVAQVWHGYDQDVASLRRVLTAVPPGSRVLMARVDQHSHPEIWHRVPIGRRLVGFGAADDHVAVLLLTLRGAFTQGMFTDPSQQPLRVLPPYDELTTPWVVDPPDVGELKPGPAQTAALASRPYLRDWEDRYDFLLVTEPAGEPDAALEQPDVLQPLGHCDIAALYRIHHNGHGE